MNSNELIEKLHHQLGKNETKSVLEQLKKLFQHTPKLKHILQQEARYNRLIEQIHLGTISRDDENVAKNKMWLTLFSLVESIGRQTAENEILQEEVEQAMVKINIAHSKNVLVNSEVSARRDNIIGLSLIHI